MQFIQGVLAGIYLVIMVICTRVLVELLGLVRILISLIKDELKKDE
ncbi:hypothetical protein [Clostridium sp.]